jgi:two-component system, NarL family, nitrate/nitrite response regulator NarL
MWSAMAESGRAKSQRKFDLTAHELEVLAAVVGGYSNNEIAQKLSISKTHAVRELAEVSRKLGVEGRLELALFAVHHRLLADYDS